MRNNEGLDKADIEVILRDEIGKKYNLQYTRITSFIW